MFRDVEATTDRHLAWTVAVHEDELVGPGMPDGAVGGIVVMGMLQPERRPLDFPQVWLETRYTGWSLPEMTDVADATGYLADLVQEDVIEEVHGAWPQCPRHPHPLEVDSTDTGRAVWTCAKTPDVTVDIGELGKLSAPPG